VCAVLIAEGLRLKSLLEELLTGLLGAILVGGFDDARLQGLIGDPCRDLVGEPLYGREGDPLIDRVGDPEETPRSGASSVSHAPAAVGDLTRCFGEFS
jgi:hypothetical protein